MRKSVFRDLRLTDSFTARNRVGCTCLSLHCYWNTMLSCVHLAFHARIQDFRQGGRGRVNLTKKSPDNVVFFWSSAYFTEVKWLISKKAIIFQGSRGSPTFPGGGGGSNLFQGGSNCLYPIETHITCDFPGCPDPLTPIWIRTCYLDQQEIAFFHLVVFGWYFSVLFKF